MDRANRRRTSGARFVAPERLDPLLAIERAGAIIGDLMITPEDAWAPARAVAQARGVQAALLADEWRRRDPARQHPRPARGRD